MQDVTPYLWSKVPTKEAVKDVIHNVGGNIIAIPRCRALHQDGTPYAFANPYFQGDDAWFPIMAGTVENNVTSVVHRNVKLAMDADAAGSLNALTDLVEVRLTYLETGSTKLSQALLDVPIGRFRLDFPDLTVSNKHDTLSVTGNDLSQYIADIEALEAPFALPQFSNYVQNAITMACMSGNPPSPWGTGPAPTLLAWPWGNNAALAPNGCPCAGPGWDPTQIISQSNDAILPFTLKLDAQQGMASGINSLLTAVNYWGFHTDSFGRLKLLPIPYQTPGYRPTAADVEWEYSTIDRSIIRDGATVKITDRQNMANRIQVVSYNTSLPRPIAVTMQNDSLQSAISVPNYGKVLFKSIRDDNIPDANTARLRCLVELNYRSISNESVEFSTAWNPLHESHDLLGLNIYARDGKLIEVSSAVAPFIESYWSIDLAHPTEMKHVAGRLIAISA